MPDDKIAQQMTQDWNNRASKNAMYYIDSRYSTDFWDRDQFYADGEQQAIDLVHISIDRLNLATTQANILEIGCGMGRLFPGFAKSGFKEIWGIDVSEEIIKLGREMCPIPTAKFVLGNGIDLGQLDQAYFDFCFSYIVLQHLPNIEIVWDYLAEVYRVLKPGGAFQLHFRERRLWKARMYLAVPARVRAWLLSLYRVGGMGNISDVPGSPETWYGVPISRQQVVRQMTQLGFTSVVIVDDTTHGDRSRFWAIGRK